MMVTCVVRLPMTKLTNFVYHLQLNCDLVIATSRSVFGLPEVARGVVAAMGGIARISQVAGHVSLRKG